MSMHVHDTVSCHHTHPVNPNQCSSTVVQQVSAPVSIIWSVVRHFDNPQTYKHFVKSYVIFGDSEVGTLREVNVISGFPATGSTERLEILDEERHVLSFIVVGGDHSVTTLHPLPAGNVMVVVESYVVDVLSENTNEETIGFVDTIVRFGVICSHWLNTRAQLKFEIC